MARRPDNHEWPKNVLEAAREAVRYTVPEPVPGGLAYAAPSGWRGKAQEDSETVSRLTDAVSKLEAVQQSLPPGTAQRAFVDKELGEIVTLMSLAKAGVHVDPARIERAVQNAETATSYAGNAAAIAQTTRMAFNAQELARLDSKYGFQSITENMTAAQAMDVLGDTVKKIGVRMDDIQGRLKAKGYDLGSEEDQEEGKRLKKAAESGDPEAAARYADWLERQARHLEGQLKPGDDAAAKDIKEIRDYANVVRGKAAQTAYKQAIEQGKSPEEAKAAADKAAGLTEAINETDKGKTLNEAVTKRSEEGIDVSAETYISKTSSQEVDEAAEKVADSVEVAAADTLAMGKGFARGRASKVANTATEGTGPIETANVDNAAPTRNKGEGDRPTETRLAVADADTIEVQSGTPNMKPKATHEKV